MTEELKKNQELNITESADLKECTKCKIVQPLENYHYLNKAKGTRHSQCKSCRSDYDKQYYIDHRDHYRELNRQWVDNNRGYYLYMIVDESKTGTDKYLYVGATTNIIKRASGHVNGYSCIKDYMALNTWTSIQYLDVTNIVNSDEEMYLLENVLIEIYEPLWNTRINIIKDIPSDRKAKLFSKFCNVHSFDNTDNWIEIRHNIKKGA